MPTSTSTPKPIHLLTIVHGMWGEPSHVSRLAEIILETHKKDDAEMDIDVLIAETNKEAHTYDGIDWGAERIVQETKERIQLLEKDGAKKVVHFSIIGYSLGGLLARYAVGILNTQGFFDTVTPVNFATIATPNIGLVRYPSWFSSLQHAVGPTMLSRTGKHFYARDNWKDGKPLLEAMSEKGGVFYDGLAKFKHVTIYANAINDLTVPFVTSAIEHFDPFVADPAVGVEVEFDELYEPIITAYHAASTPAPEMPKPPKTFSKKWWKNFYSGLPPPLQRRFPYNVFIIGFLPLLIPLLIATVFGNFTYNVFHSKRRIRVLEASGNHSRSALLTFVQSIEAGVEDAVVDLLDDDVHDADRPSPPSTTNTTPARTRTSTPLPPTKITTTAAPSTTTSSSTKRTRYLAAIDAHSFAKKSKPSNPNKNQPILTASQHRIIDNLNSLPNLQKHLVFLDEIRNTHATIVCRDLKNFEFHKRGEGVLRCLADGFEM